MHQFVLVLWSGIGNLLVLVGGVTEELVCVEGSLLVGEKDATAYWFLSPLNVGGSHKGIAI